VTSGQATAAQTANTFTVNQLTDKAILNWASFNISADGNVVFNQLTGKNAIALNRIHDANPSQIFGSLKSNGQIYLINQNGILFGATANVNTGGLLASTLNMTDQVFNDGLLSALQTGASTGVQNALFKDGASSTIAVKPGAKITTNDAGQRILLAAGTVENGGDLTAIDGGQVVLAAGQKVYIAASDDAKLRGLLVEVDGGGTVTNTGSVTAERGNVTAVGLAVNQNGRITATTSVSDNGSIRLLARDTVSVARADSGVFQIQGVTRGGALNLGVNSSTQVSNDAASTAKAIDDQEQSPSTVDLIAKTIDLKSGSQIVAHGGKLTAIAASTLSTLGNNIDNDPAAHFRMDDGAVIDLSGSVANTSVTRNLLAVELRANELADAPLQRDGVLRGKTVVIDARVGTPLAKVDGAIALIERDVAERTSTGGTVAIESAGDVVMAAKASINVSGGAVNYAGGAMRTSQLVKADGTTVDIGNASPNVVQSMNPANNTPGSTLTMGTAANIYIKPAEHVWTYMVEGRLENTVAWTEEDFGKLSLKDVIANIVKTNERRASSEWNNKRANWNDAFSREVQETIIYELAMLTDGRRVAIFDGSHDEADV
jgi:filamentous hemagglutinin family protein